MCKQIPGCALLALCLLTLAVQAAPSYRVTKSYPELGLNVRTLGGGTPEPLPQPQVHTYTFTPSQGASYRRDLFSLHELWYTTQHAGQWRDAQGNLLILAQATRLKPQIAAQMQDHIPREEFEQALAASNDDTVDSPAKLARWLADFTGLSLAEPVKARAGFSLQQALFYPADSQTLVCAFQPRPRSMGQQSAPADWFVAVVKVADGTAPDKLRRDFETQFLAHVSAIPKVGQSAPTAANTFKPAGAGTPVPAHPSRTAAHRSIANMQGWWHADTPEYTFLTDVRSAMGQRLIRDVQTELSALRRAFTRLVPPLVEAIDINIVRIFENAEDYKQYVGGDIEWSSGCWSPARRELVIQSQGKDRAQTLAIIRHEGFHQYLFYATDMLENAMWYNEGHACFFEETRLDSRGNLTILENQRLNFLLDNLEAVSKHLPIVLRARHADFYGGTNQQRQLNYTSAWALVYFLRKAVPALKHEAYARVLDDYLKHLAATKDCARATELAFEGVDMTSLQRDFRDSWTRHRNTARRFDPLPPLR